MLRVTLLAHPEAVQSAKPFTGIFRASVAQFRVALTYS